MLIKKAISIVSVMVLMLAPQAAVLAQSAQSDLREAIQASVMSDPRVQGVPPDQLKGLIDALVAEAETQQMSSADILWQPQNALAASTAAGEEVCAPGWQGYPCVFNRVFGFDGSDYSLPILLLVTSGIAVLVIWELVAHHRKHEAQKASTVSTSSAQSPVQKILK
jgi:hypothetical protein